MRRPVDRYINTLLRRRRPRPFRPGDEDIAVTRTAIDLLAAGPDAQAPSPRFVEELRRRVAANDPTPHTGPDAAAPAAAARPRLAPQRRRLLAVGALTATGAAGGVTGAVAERLIAGTPTATAQPAAPQPQASISPTTGSWQTIAAGADLPEGAVLSFDLGSVTGFARRVAGRVQAISGICTHQGCRLSLDTPRDTLVCPCHGATFTVAGAPLTHPNRLIQSLPALPRLAVREAGGHIQIYAPDAA